MMLKDLKPEDQGAMSRAQTRNFGHNPHSFTVPKREIIMGAANAALAKVAAAKKSTKKNGKPAPKKTTKKTSGRGASEQDRTKVAKMYNGGSTISEITEAMGWEKPGNFPHYYTKGVIRQLRAKGEVDFHRDPNGKKKSKKNGAKNTSKK
jgi:hypothetical protein